MNYEMPQMDLSCAFCPTQEFRDKLVAVGVRVQEFGLNPQAEMQTYFNDRIGGLCLFVPVWSPYKIKFSVWGTNWSLEKQELHFNWPLLCAN